MNIIFIGKITLPLNFGTYFNTDQLLREFCPDRGQNKLIPTSQNLLQIGENYTQFSVVNFF